MKAPKTVKQPGKGTTKAGGAEAKDLLNMEQAIAMLKTSRPTFYRWLRSGRIKGMKVGRQWRFYRRDVEAFLSGKAPQIELKADISPLVEELKTRVKGAGGKVPAQEEGQTAVTYVIRLVVELARRLRASDIHLTSHMPMGHSEPVGVLRLRVDGVLQVIAEIDQRLMSPLVDEWKRLAACDLNERKRTQDGRILLQLPAAKGEPGSLDLRVNFVPSIFGESVTARILDRSVVMLDLDRLPYSDPDRARIEKAVAEPWGVVFCTGPTGSGKTTTLYSCLNRVTKPGVKVVTAEDPVEYHLPWVTQIPIRPAVGMNFPAVLRSILRADPDVIMVGEIRNLESAQMVVQAALTGHLVMTTLHTDDAASALQRLLDIGVDPFLVIDATRLIIAQRLVRHLCADCKKAYKPNAEERRQLKEMAQSGGIDPALLGKSFKQAVGCVTCGQTGHRGRTVVAETLEITPALARALRKGAEVDELRRLAVEGGMVTMAANAAQRAAAGEITVQEAARVCRI